MTPRFPPRVFFSLLSSPSLAAALSCFHPSCPAFPLSPRVLFALYSSLSLFFSLSRTLFPLLPSIPFAYFFALDRRGKQRDAIQSFERSAASRTPGGDFHPRDRFAELRHSVTYALLSPRRRSPSFSSTCGGSSLLHMRMDVTYLTRVSTSRVFRVPYLPSTLPSPPTASFVASRYGFHELSAVSRHHSPCHLSETHACVRSLFFRFALSLSFAPPLTRFSPGSRTLNRILQIVFLIVALYNAIMHDFPSRKAHARARARTRSATIDDQNMPAPGVEKRLVDISARRLSGMTARPALSPPLPLPLPHVHVSRLPPRAPSHRVPTTGALHDTLWTSGAQRAMLLRSVLGASSI